MANITGTENNDLIVGTDENDVISGGAGQDELHGGAGDDVISAGSGTDIVYGEAGDDIIHGGGDNDILNGGEGSDTFIIDQTDISTTGILNTTIEGGSTGSDYDTLNLGPLLAQGFVITHLVENAEANGQPGADYQISLTNPDTGAYININAKDIENFVPCFTPGTMIATPRGEVPVEDLREGDQVITRDNGLQEVCWTGSKPLSGQDMMLAPDLRPVLVRAGALGRGLPQRDMLVSPNHRLLITDPRTELYFNDPEVFAAAKHMVDGKGIVRLESQPVTYVHFMCERHEVVLSDGAWTESFQPGDQALKGAGQAAQKEIFALFPELQDHGAREAYVAARRTLKRHEAKVLIG
ncbi:MAG: Hint domain-containing protein [Maritimibacter sp.]